uniref:Ornithine decarboxylase n=1 Tax=Moschus moschiferus TaxID=68415 RepID=A0A8C6CI87_MOSMO
NVGFLLDSKLDWHFLDEGFTANDILDQKINEVSSSDDKDAFYVADLGDIPKKHLRWLDALPRVTPFYAVKCNDSRTIVRTLAAIGTGFDCAKITSVINPALDKYFPSDSGVRIIAEPGRYYVASAFTLAVNIIESSEQTFMYYVNDGVYGSFNCILYDHAHVKPLLQKRPKPDEKYYSSSIWGPTCASLDRIVERCNRMWAIGCSLRTWVLTLLLLLLPSMDSRVPPSTM